MFKRKDKKSSNKKKLKRNQLPSDPRDMAALSGNAQQHTDVMGLPDDKESFWLALRGGDIEMVARIIDKNSDAISWRDQNGNLPLLTTCWPTTRNAEMTALLLTHGANAKDPAVFSATLMRGEDSTIIDLLFDHGYTPSIEDMFLAAQSNAPQALKKCLDAGLDVNAQDNVPRRTAIRIPGATALHYAAMYNTNIQTLEILLDAGAQIDARDKKGRTPLMCAISHGQTATAIKLAGEGANLKLRDKGLQNAFSIAKSAGNHELRKTLIAIKNGAKKPFFGRFK